MPWINENCRGCKKCPRACLFLAIKMEDNKAVINQQKCVKCGKCLQNICPFEAIRPDEEYNV